VALRLRASIEILAPAAKIFSVLCSPERLPEWNTSVETARRLQPEEPVTLGSRAVMTGRVLGQRLESETEVVRFEPTRMFATQACRGPRLLTQFDVESLATGARVTADVSGEVPGGAVGSMLAEGFLKRELSASLHRLKAICEREAQGEAANTPAQGGDPACWLHLAQRDED
jgi:uncharacterized membrane protein